MNLEDRIKTLADLYIAENNLTDDKGYSDFDLVAEYLLDLPETADDGLDVDNFDTGFDAGYLRGIQEALYEVEMFNKIGGINE